MTTITREQAQAVSDLKAGYTLGHADVAILKDLARIALASLEAEPVTEWTNEQCLEFLSIALRHAEIKGDLELDDIRLGMKMVNGSRAAVLQGADGNSPVIPDGWVAVPVEPTEDMIVNGFESEPDESFSDEKEWEAYEAMSGCQQAAHRATLCWAAMIAARPKLKHDLT